MVTHSKKSTRDSKTQINSYFVRFALYICIYIYTYTKSFYKLYSNFSIFTVTNKLLSILLYNKKYHDWDHSSLGKAHEQR